MADDPDRRLLIQAISPKLAGDTFDPRVYELTEEELKELLSSPLSTRPMAREALQAALLHKQTSRLSANLSANLVILGTGLASLEHTLKKSSKSADLWSGSILVLSFIMATPLLRDTGLYVWQWLAPPVATISSPMVTTTPAGAATTIPNSATSTTSSTTTMTTTPKFRDALSSL